MGANNMQSNMPHSEVSAAHADRSIGRIVSVTGAKAIVLLDCPKDERIRLTERPGWGLTVRRDTVQLDRPYGKE